MSDTYRRYRAIKQAIMQFYQPRPTGHREKHLTTLTALICGLTGGKHAHLPIIADQAPSNGTSRETLIRRFTRFLKNERQTIEGWFLPVAQQLLTTLATQPLQIVIDGSTVGRGCLALMLSVLYHGRALPLCWLVVKAAKGHFPVATDRELLAQLQAIMSKDAQVTFLGDGEGFHIDKSHLSEPKRLSRLLIASCLAYIWIVYLGVCALQEEWMKRLHRRKRCDLSLFRLDYGCSHGRSRIISRYRLVFSFRRAYLCRSSIQFRSWPPSSYFLSGSQTKERLCVSHSHLLPTPAVVPILIGSFNS